MVSQELKLNWTVRQAGVADANPITATVPGDIHRDLLRAGRIPDPFVADNEKRVQWVGEQEWIYAHTFTAETALLGHERILLCCEGLDTMATLALNGTEIGKTDNMFRIWAFDIKAALREGTNHLCVRFASAASFVKAQAAARPANRLLPQWRQPGALPGAHFIRKMQCNFGWDWGPCLVTCGIWRPIRLVAFSTARLADVHIRQCHHADAVELDIRLAAVFAQAATPLSARVHVRFGEEPVAEARVTLRRGKGVATIRIAEPRLWWPNGMGGQPLYTVGIELLDGSQTVLDTASRRIGLRTLRLDRHADTWGESFRFVANGVPFFAKGANWIPADAVLSRLNTEDYRRLLADTASVHMNMLRVWGGGIYENDDFYDRCDELGICVWQDFMFACAAYETRDRAFMRNIHAEASDNIRRLRHHACLALWCGNNELEMGLVADHWYNPPKHTRYAMSWKDYGKLFDKLLPDLIGKLDPDRDYWPGSPHTPPPFDRGRHDDPRAGDAHLWKVWHGREPFEWYRTCEHRFNSEFGFQSFPEPQTLNPVIPPGERNVTSGIMEHHQRSQIGNTAIMQYMLDWFRMPADFESTLWLSQILQGNAIRYAVEHWRRSMPRGMGTLYWQLNDCWPVASWSSIDYAGRWKALHYMARRFYAPCMVSGLENNRDGSVELHVTNDRAAAGRGVIHWRATDAAGKLLRKRRLPVRFAANADTTVATLDFAKERAKQGDADLLIWIELLVGGQCQSSSLVTFARPKRLQLREPGLHATVAKGPGESYSISVTANRPALWCWLELTDAGVTRWSDNFFHLDGASAFTLTVIPGKRLTLADCRQRLRVRSLFDTWTG